VTKRATTRAAPSLLAGLVLAGGACGGSAAFQVDGAAAFDGSPDSGDSGSCVAGGWCWSNPSPDGTSVSKADLMGVWANAPNDAWVVGGRTNGDQTRAILHWDGVAWHPFDVGSLGAFRGVWSNGSDDVWAVGDPGVFRRTAGGFEPVDTGVLVGAALGVWGSSSDDVWIVGLGGAIHWDGRTFETSLAQGLSSVWGSGPNDVWAVGDGSVMHFDGTEWSSVWVEGTCGSGFSSVWGSGPTDLWGVGGGGTIARWNGKAWTPLASGTTANLTSVWGSGPDDVWFVGQGDETWQAGTGVTLHWDGTALSNAGSNISFAAVGGSGPSDVWAVGAAGAILHHAGAVSVVDGGAPEAAGFADPGSDCSADGWCWSWRTQTPDAFRNIAGIWGASPSDIWAGGGIGILHFDGVGWSKVPTASANIVPRAVWGSSASDVWAVGNGVLHFDGTSWLGLSPCDPLASLSSVWGVGPSDVWAGSDDPEDQFARWNGAAWTIERVRLPGEFIHATWGAATDDIWIGGHDDLLGHWDGKMWTSFSHPPLTFIWGMWGSGPRDVWTVGAKGIIHWDGTAWSTVPSGTAAPLTAVSGTGAGDAWAVGPMGTILHWDGLAWTAQASGTTASLAGVWASGPGEAWAAGDGGILHRSPH